MADKQNQAGAAGTVGASIDTPEFHDLLDTYTMYYAHDVMGRAEKIKANLIAHIDARLAAPASAQPAPLGGDAQAEYALVPKVPTQEMLDAARNAPLPMVMLDSMSAQQDLMNKSRFAAMLAASPATVTAPAQPADPDLLGALRYVVQHMDIAGEKLMGFSKDKREHWCGYLEDALIHVDSVRQTAADAIQTVEANSNAATVTEPATPATVAVPLATAKLIDGAFLPQNPNKMRSAAPEVIAAAHEFKALLSAAPATTEMVEDAKDAAQWESRRWCKGDALWTPWVAISNAEYERRKGDETFEFRAAMAAQQAQASARGEGGHR